VWMDPKQAQATADQWDRSGAERTRASLDEGHQSGAAMRKQAGIDDPAVPADFSGANEEYRSGWMCAPGSELLTWNSMKDWKGENCVGMDEILREAQTGDVILFDNVAMVGTVLIACLTRSEWDHCGVVIRFPEPIGVRLLEAVAPRVVMDRLDLVVSQVQNGRMYWRQLKKKDGSALWTAEEENSIRAKAQTLFDRPYENNLDELVQAWKSGETYWIDKETQGLTKGFCCDQRYTEPEQTAAGDGDKETAAGQVKQKIVEAETEQRLFCSECVGAVYKHAGLISDHLEACNFLPKDFSTDAHATLELNENFELLPEKKILHYKAGPSGGAVDANGLPIDMQNGSAEAGSGGRPDTFLV